MSLVKSLVIILAGLFIILQYKLWFEAGGIAEVIQLKHSVAKQTAENNQLVKLNAELMTEITDLKNGQAAIEEHARNDLGMVKPGEVFYQVIEQ